MIRLVSIAAALATSAALLGATAGHAQNPGQNQGGYYIATPAATPTKAGIITRSTPWSLHDGVYVADKAPERDGVLCELVAKNVGKLSGFTAGGKVYDAAALDKCNVKAK